MHYQNGREAKVGDRVVGRDWSGKPVSGVVVAATPGSTTCNIEVVPIRDVGTYTSSDFLHIDDAVPLPAKAAQ